MSRNHSAHLPRLALAIGGAMVLGSAMGGAALAAQKKAASLQLARGSLSAFTPANADPRLAARLGRIDPSLGGFNFTPAASKKAARAIRVAVRAQGSGPAAMLASVPTGASALTPSSYNLGAAVGWKRFALSGNLAKVDDKANPAIGRESYGDVGISYNLKRVTTRLSVATDSKAPRVATLVPTEAYSLDLGTAIKLGKRVAVTGGVRYRVEEDRAAALADQRRDSQAVYVGTAIRF